MEAEELQEVLKRGTVESDIIYHDTERVQGLGFAPVKEMAGMEKGVKVDHLIEQGAILSISTHKMHTHREIRRAGKSLTRTEM